MVTPRAMNYYLQDHKKWLETHTAGQREDYSSSNVHKYKEEAIIIVDT
jgi:hypothetical protein